MSYLTYEWLWRNGRLGNQLWQIASTAGIATSKAMQPRFPKWEYQRYFNVPDEWFVEQLPEPREDLGTDYLQQLQHLAWVAGDVREWFAPTDEVQAALEAAYPWFFDLGHTTAVHVRRGDYTKYPDHFPLPTQDYYRSACKQIASEAPHTTFVVFSDDIKWCEKNLNDYVFDSHPVHFVHGQPRPVEMKDRKGEPADQLDLFLMSLCDEHIISNSTFSWWGAFLSGNPKPIYPSIWFGPALDYQQCPAPTGWRRFESC